MSRRDASAEEAATKEDEAGTATDEEATIKEEDTENTINPKIIFLML